MNSHISFFPLADPCAQLNIFLAILIEGYTAVKRGAEMSRGLPQELLSIATHEICRLLSFFKGGTDFVSDDQLAEELGARLYHTPKFLSQAMQDYAVIALGDSTEVSTHKPVHAHQMLLTAWHIAIVSSSSTATCGAYSFCLYWSGPYFPIFQHSDLNFPCNKISRVNARSYLKIARRCTSSRAQG